MIAALQRPNFGSSSMTLCSSKASRSKRRQRRVKEWQIHESKNTLSFPKSTPTPLIIHHEPYNQTKFQALEAVVNDLEAAIEKGIKIDIETYASLLETCYNLQAIDYGIRIHRIIPRSLLHRNVGISSKLLRLYASFGHMDKAHDLFDQMPKRNVYAFPWNSLISGYAEVGLYHDAMAIYFQMVEEGVEPDVFTFPRVLKACGGIRSVQVGEEVHRHVVRSGFYNDGFVLNALVDMYAKCGDVIKAWKIFDKIHNKDSVSWNSMLSAFIHHGLELEALNLFRQMLILGHMPDSVSISTILAAASSLGFGVQIHGWLIRRGFEWKLSIANALIVVYSKLGKLDQACWIFNHMSEKDVVSWNSIISAHSKHREALKYFEQMEEAGVLPDKITFVSVLSACAYLRFVKGGERLFSLMTEKYRITPSMEHFACMVNLYGRAGLIREAYSVILDRMESVAGPTVWGALLYACFLHGNVTIGEIAANKLFDLEPDNEHNFKVLMDIYQNAGKSEDVERVRKMLLDRGLDH